MHEQLTSIIERELGKVDTQAMAARQAVYDRVRGIVARLNGGGPTNAHSIEMSLALESAIDQIESRFLASSETRVEKALHAMASTLNGFKTKYGAFAALTTTLSDFIKPVIELTQPIMFGSAALGAVFLILGQFAGSFRGTMRTGMAFCAMLFVCSAGWFGLQKLVPGANASGAVATLVPGARAIQDVVVAALGRIEVQTKRVGDILEDSQKRTRDQQKEAERKQHEELEMMRQRIVDAGYSLDAGGLLNAVRAGYRYVGDFARLNIKPTEAAVAAELPLVASKDEVTRLREYLNREKDDYGFIRRIVQALDADREKLKSVFEGPHAHAALCRREAYTHGFAWARVEQVCKTEGFTFAMRYVEFANDGYALQLRPTALSSGNIETLPTAKLGNASMGRLPARCAYYEVNATFRVAFASLGHIENNFSFNVFYDGIDTNVAPTVDIVDPEYEKFKFEDDCLYAKLVSTNRACSARFILASSCEGSNIRLLKVLATSSVAQRTPPPSSTTPAAPTQSAYAPPPPATAVTPAAPLQTPGVPTPTYPPPVPVLSATPVPVQKQTDPGRPTAPLPSAKKSTEGALTADTVRRILLGNEIDHAGKLSFIYKPDGTFDAADGRVASSGRYRIESDGRVCWDNSRGISGCFLYYRKSNALHVRRADATSRDEIGPVKLTSR